MESMANLFDKKVELILEQLGKYKLSTSFVDLPDNAPHGFWITKDGQFVTVYNMFGHDDALQALFKDVIGNEKGISALTKAMKAGMIRMAKMPLNTYGVTYHPHYLKGTGALKTAKDIAQHYNMTLENDFEGL